VQIDAIELAELVAGDRERDRLEGESAIGARLREPLVERRALAMQQHEHEPTAGRGKAVPWSAPEIAGAT
jgi:hypothetical protein